MLEQEIKVIHNARITRYIGMTDGRREFDAVLAMAKLPKNPLTTELVDVTSTAFVDMCDGIAIYDIPEEPELEEFIEYIKDMQEQPFHNLVVIAKEFLDAS